MEANNIIIVLTMFILEIVFLRPCLKSQNLVESIMSRIIVAFSFVVCAAIVYQELSSLFGW